MSPAAGLKKWYIYTSLLGKMLRGKKAHIEVQKLRQCKFIKKQVNDFECWTAEFNPPYIVSEAGATPPPGVYVFKSKDFRINESIELANSGPEFQEPERE